MRTDRSVLIAAARAMLAGVLILAAMPLLAQPARPSDGSVLSFTVGIAELAAPDSPAEQRYLASGFSRLLLQELDGIETHLLSPAERAAIATGRLDEHRTTAARELDAAITRRDELFFRRPPPGDTAREQADAAVDDARERLDALLAATPRLVSVPERAPIDWWAAHTDGSLLDPSATGHTDGEPTAEQIDGIRARAQADGIDLLVFGRLETVEQYALVDVYVYSSVLHRIVYHDRTAGQAREVLADVRRIAEGVATVLLGREHGGIAITTNVPDAVISVDGTVVGYGDAELRYAEPETRLVTVTAPGFGAVEDAVVLIGGETVARDYTLEPVTRGEIRLTTTPSSASVFLNSIWVGVTPLSISRPSVRQQVRLEAEGYFDSRFRVGPDSPEMISRDLRAANIDWDLEIQEMRDGFYRALGWFVLSVPVPMFLFGAYQSVAAAFPEEPPEEPDGLLSIEEWVRFGKRGNVLYWSALGSTFVSAGLLVNAFLALFDYVAVGEASHYL